MVLGKEKAVIYHKPLMAIVGCVNHFKTTPTSDLSIPGDAPKKYLISVKDNRRYIAKTAQKHGLHEVLTEYLMNVVGMHLKNNLFSRSRLGWRHEHSKQPVLYFLSEVFLRDNERLTHGEQIMYRFVHQEAKASVKYVRKLYAFEDIETALELVYEKSKADELLKDVATICLVDAWLGNMDRHGGNWGFIEPIQKDTTSNSVRIAPIYDTSRGLCWNFTEQKVQQLLSNEKSLDRYINDSVPRISCAEQPNCNHFQLIEFILKYYPDIRAIFRKYTSDFKSLNVNNILDMSVFLIGLSPARRCIIEKILKKRLHYLVNLVDKYGR